MNIYYSPSENGFFTDYHKNRPKDCRIITQERYEELISKQEAGMRIVPDENGNPILIEPEIQIEPED